ncbi:MAG: hypothetical protein KDH15_19650 [Rhodocyclaceae bacterium]|nr:hypothetical protein [Rhodocyclaceae bacterium]
MAKPRYLRTDEREEAVRSLEWAEQQARSLADDPYLWKWVLIALHNAAQGFMVLALWNGNGLLALRDKVAAKWLSAYENGGPYPVEKLDEFLNLYKKVKDKGNIHVIGAGPFVPGPTHDVSFTRLNEYRNEFIHFTPKGWSLQLAGLPRVGLDALDLIQFFGWESTAVLWHKQALVSRAKRAVKRLRQTLHTLEGAYGG